MSHSHSHGKVSGRKLVWTIVFNLVISIAELIGGLMSGYLALIADAVHNLSDVAALGLAWLGVKGSELPATKKSTYGYKRIEVMTAFISAVSLVVIAIFILREAYLRFLDPQPLTHPWVFMIVAVIGLIGNLLSIWMLHGEKSKSLNTRTAYLHMAYDAISSVGVIIGGAIILVTGWFVIDVILSIIIALMIFWSSWLVIREAVMIFMEAIPRGIDFDMVHASIAAVDRVNNVHDLHVWSLSSNEAALSCHICVNDEDYAAGPEIIQQLNQTLDEQFHIGHVTIQIIKGDCDRSDILCRTEHQHEESDG